MIAPVIEVSDDGTATGSWYLWQPCTVVGPDGPQAVWLTGCYADRYRHEEEHGRRVPLRVNGQGGSLVNAPAVAGERRGFALDRGHVGVIPLDPDHAE